MLTDSICNNAYILRMSIDRTKVVSFINDALRMSGIESVSSLATRSGLAASTLNRYYYERTDKIGLATLNRIAIFVGYKSYEDYVSKKALGKKDELVKVRGYIGAGQEIIMLDDSVLEEVAPPAGYYADGIEAAVVRGDSMQPQLEDGWLVFYRARRESVSDECLHKLCVVKLRNDGLLVKIVKPGSKPNLFHLLSKNPSFPPLFDQKLIWSSRVIDIRPR